MNERIYLLLIFVIFSSCDNQIGDTSDSRNINPLKTSENTLIEDKKIIKEVVEMRFFSSRHEKDTFILILKGDSIYDGTVDFIIISYNGDSIFNQTYNAVDLIGYGLTEMKNPTVYDYEQYILMRMNSFFSEDRFLKPAIDSNINYDSELEYLISEDTWGRIKGDTSSIGFIYHIKEESFIKIVFDKSKREVIQYDSCC
ncbi:MAG: hypothetical protein ACK40G_18165 [Cytophagaceae bacterium]